MDASVEFRSKVELQRQAIHTQAAEIGRNLAGALNEAGVEGGGWTHQTRPGYSYLSLDLFHTSGLHLVLRHEGGHRKGNAGRMLTVSGGYPHGYCGHRAGPVNVGISTSAGHMARRITRYFLPEYRKTLTVALEQHRKAQLDEQTRRRLNRRMERVLPALRAAGHEPDNTRDARTASYWYTRLPTRPDSPRALASGRVRLSSSGTEAEELRLTGVPQDLLLQILALLNPSRPIQGRIMPRAIAPARRPLSAARIIPGEVIGSSARATHASTAQDGARPALPGAPREEAWQRLFGRAPADRQDAYGVSLRPPRPGA